MDTTLGWLQPYHTIPIPSQTTGLDRNFTFSQKRHLHCTIMKHPKNPRRESDSVTTRFFFPYMKRKYWEYRLGNFRTSKFPVQSLELWRVLTTIYVCQTANQDSINNNSRTFLSFHDQRFCRSFSSKIRTNHQNDLLKVGINIPIFESTNQQIFSLSYHVWFLHQPCQCTMKVTRLTGTSSSKSSDDGEQGDTRIPVERWLYHTVS